MSRHSGSNMARVGQVSHEILTLVPRFCLTAIKTMATDEITSLKALVSDALAKRGVLGKIKAQLRSSVFSVLQNEAKPLPLENGKVQALHASPDGRIALALVRDFLKHLDLEYTLAVFDPEASMTDLVLNDVEVHSALNLPEKEDKDKPLLLHLLDNRGSQQLRPIKSVPVPQSKSTSSWPPPSPIPISPVATPSGPPPTTRLPPPPPPTLPAAPASQFPLLGSKSTPASTDDDEESGEDDMLEKMDAILGSFEEEDESLLGTQRNRHAVDQPKQAADKNVTPEEEEIEEMIDAAHSDQEASYMNLNRPGQLSDTEFITSDRTVSPALSAAAYDHEEDVEIDLKEI
ncbi:uncharacterized protein SPPG_06968 [Spizellomyces punctatus DAOM BR117]|uniref:Centrosomal protein 43 n=1 Tax=Spizellomyces punctatus (strain DAOM BR117) TaxID=645134 RepID=A0A0L0HAQ6_SPIPD|nr:uncharacterized protein SPPG_06968 [Spizellomyces punctatus DAOM BR117]KNC97979.1 hypothetical protein SPPG_06968 [Spizellomyces punctatus DAOM BR117]|eukprot:XP_016606019.1 hypothetical protein SPPG_06968 [Spizellomyces punctatus DAOM BR117]